MSVHGLHRAASRGQATVEFAMVSVVLAGALFVPWYAGRSPADHLATAILRWLESFSYLISIV